MAIGNWFPLLGALILAACSNGKSNSPSVSGQGNGPPAPSADAGSAPSADSGPAPAPEAYLLDLSRVGLGSGLIRIQPSDLECANACSMRFEPGSKLSLTAVPESGSRFVEWLGTCQGSGPCSLVAGEGPAVAARFEPEATPVRECRSTKAREATDLFTGGISLDKMCLENGWCWENAPVGRWLNAVWALADDDVWAVGSDTALHWDGSSWNGTKLPRADIYLTAVWGSERDDVWALGSDVVVHWDGTAWSEVALPVRGLHLSISGTSRSDVWILILAPGAPYTLHWDGSSWSSASPRAGMTKIFAIAPGHAIAIGRGCDRWDGSSWRAEPCGVRGANSVWASGPNDIWVTGHVSINEGPNGDLYYRAHWDGASWASEDVPRSSTPSYSGFLFGTASDDLWWGNVHFDGQTWSTVTNNKNIYPTAGVAGGKLWAAAGGIWQSDGTEWKLAMTSTPDRPKMAGGLRGDDLWVLMETGAILGYDGSCWDTIAGPEFDERFQFDYHAAFGSSSADIWLVGRYESQHWDGKHWSPIQIPAGVAVAGNFGGWSNGPGDTFLFAIDDSETRAFHWNGKEWSLHARFEGERVYSWWGSGSDDLWLGGYRMNGKATQPRIWHWNGTDWSLKPIFGQETAAHVRGPFGTIRGDVWTSSVDRNGAQIQRLRWNGKQFAPVIEKNQAYGFQVASGPDDQWRLSSAGLFHLEKDGWAASPFFAPKPDLASIGNVALKGIPGFGIVAAGSQGAIYLRHR
jgi:hypothetical protein